MSQTAWGRLWWNPLKMAYMLYWIKSSPQRQTHHLHPCWSTNAPPSLLPQCQTFAHQIQLTQAQSECLCMCHSWRWRKGELQVDHWHLRSQSWMLEPSNLPRLDWMQDLCDKLPEDVSIPRCHGSHKGDGHCATWQRHPHIAPCLPPSQEKLQYILSPLTWLTSEETQQF